MFTVSTKDYTKLLERCYQTKQPLMVFGGFGIGKSQIPTQVFERIASKRKRTFVRWEETTDEQKEDIIANADKYFVFCDQRIGQMDSTDLRGIPNMMNTEALKTIPYSWVIYFTQEDADGVLFFDEINLAPPTVAGSAYQIINDRTISDRKLSDNVFVMGAGNRAEDKAHIFDMPMPLHDRFCEVEVSVDLDDWTEWASANGVNSHLISFVQWKPHRLYYVKVKNDKPSTPRAIYRASVMLGDTEVTSDDALWSIAVSCGEAFATEFQAYAKHVSKLNWNTIFKNPDSIKKFEIDKLWAVVGGLSDIFKKGVKQEKFDQMVGVVMAMPADFAIVALRMIKDADKKTFVNSLKGCKHFKEIANRYAKFIIA